MTQHEGALVLLSGGQDSAVCLAWALDRFKLVETVGFDYGQHHRVELECRDRVREGIAALKPRWADRFGNDHTLALNALGEVSNTALTRDVAIKIEDCRLPNTFVPGRNIIFLTFAAALAYRRGLRHIVGGMCETDYSGYPDCRDDTIKALQVTLNLGMERRFVMHTPLMWIDKAQTWKLAHDLGGDGLIDLIVSETHTCYLGDRSHLHKWGYGCGECPACRLRADGFHRYRGGTLASNAAPRGSECLTLEPAVS
jgi:7-cyano-7-deazaguanine synthase